MAVFYKCFFFSKGFLFFSKLHPSSQIFHSLNRKKMLKLSLLHKKYWSVSEKNGSQTFPLFFSWQICIWTLLTFLKKKNQHLWRAKERKKIVDNQKRHELSFFFFFSLIISKKKKTNDSQKKINLIFGNRRRQLQKNENKRKKCILVPRLIHSSYRLYKETENSGNFWIFSSFGQRNAPLFFWLIYLFFFWGGNI